MENHFRNRVAIVTGGASGIGKALCRALSHAGARVIVADIDLEGAQRTAAELSPAGDRAWAALMDVTRRELVEGIVSDAVSRHGRLDYFFNNAAATATRGEFREVAFEPWHRAIAVNLLGVVHGTAAAYEAMIRQKSGHIVNIGSLAGLVGFPTSIPYGASKAAVVNLSVSLRMEAETLGVKVSVVCPGPVHGDDPGLIGVDRAAGRILDGVARNHAIIVFPFSARLMWWLYRLSPGILFPLGRKMVRDRRERRVQAGTPAERK